MAQEGQQTRNAILDLEGANCTSCSIAIEHLGRRLDGVSEIRVDRAKSVIHVAYHSDTAVLDKLCDFIRHIGYNATIRTSDNTA